MTTEDFWDIVHSARTLSDGMCARLINKILIITRRNHMKTPADLAWDRRAETLSTLLSELPPGEVAEFDHIFQEQMDRAYSWNLWGAAYILGEGGCSDDAFTDFRSWLISMGKDVFEKALDDPDSLSAISFGPNPGDEPDAFFEEYAYIARRVYEEKTGEEMPSPLTDFPEEPAGKKWEDEDLPVRYPKLWEQNKRLIE